MYTAETDIASSAAAKGTGAVSEPTFGTVSMAGAKHWLGLFPQNFI
jgi:hypothetical protein